MFAAALPRWRGLGNSKGDPERLGVGLSKLPARARHHQGLMRSESGAAAAAAAAEPVTASSWVAGGVKVGGGQMRPRLGYRDRWAAAVARGAAARPAAAAGGVLEMTLEESPRISKNLQESRRISKNLSRQRQPRAACSRRATRGAAEAPAVCFALNLGACFCVGRSRQLEARPAPATRRPRQRLEGPTGTRMLDSHVSPSSVTSYRSR